MQNLKRNMNMGFRVTVEEKEQIMKRMNEIGFSSVRSYMLKMALNGYIINLDLSDVRVCGKMLRSISNSINQIAKRVNETGNIYADDLADIKAQLDGIWHQQDKIIKDLSKIFEVK